ncbi:MAG: helix-turn-helix transcriptional regulator [Clostridia bacterium]|nr:helix-turn-helix transcriptional regulator [Clostridia bacterium]
MTVGNKIRFFREKCNHSQDDLAQKIGVSTETVNLWETDNASPEINDLVALKDVFCVSVDDIISPADPYESAETPAEIPAESPIESYEFRYTEAEIKDLYGKAKAPLSKRIIVFSLLLAAFAWFALANDSLMGAVLAIMCGVWLWKCVKAYLQYQKAEKTNLNKMPGNIYRYDTYYEYFKVHIERSDGSADDIKVYYGEIRNKAELGEFLALATEERMFIIKKAEIRQNSGFYYITPVPKFPERKKPVGKQRAVSITLFVCSIATLWGALIGVAVLSGINYLTVENTWVFFLFTPIPIASIVFSAYLKKRGYKYKFNLIVGIVMVILLCLYGSFCFVFDNVFSHGDESIVNAENAMKIDIPEHKHINTQDWTQGNQSGMRGYVYYVSDVYFTDEAVKEFESSLSSDPKWLSSVPSNMIGISSPYHDVEGYDYVIIYNVDTNEFNALPSEARSYRFINVLYSCKRNTMAIVEYETEYKK